MTEIGFNLGGDGFASAAMDTFIDSFWTDSSNFLTAPFCELKPTSPGSTKSTSSLDSFLQGVSNPPSGSTPPLSPWKNELEEGLIPSTCDRRNSEVGDAVIDLWHGSVPHEPHPRSAPSPTPLALPDHNEAKKTTILSADLLQGFDETEANSTSHGLEEQLASADNAWTAALELPVSVTEDVNNLLNQAHKSVSTTSHLPHQRKRRRRRRRKAPSCKESSPTFSTLTDPESTETGSENEEQDIQENSRQRNRCHMFIAGRMEVVEDLSISDLDDDIGEDSYQPPKRKNTLSSPLPPTPSPVPRHCQPLTVNYAEPWWPQRSGSVHQRLSARDIDSSKVGGSDVGRSRRQLELWEFILRSLDSRPVKGTMSAFKWVDRSVGVFRVTDTQKAAREWGLYRGNARMDYEKMARAMRFYYKECVLRKARKQLHFQFSMPFVAWSKRQHLLEGESTPGS